MSAWRWLPKHIARGSLILAVCLAVPWSKAAAQSAIPTFESLGISWSPGGSGTVTVQYRALGSSVWKTGHNLWLDAAEYRGSIVLLKPDTTYEIQLTQQGGATATFTAKTWSENFPIANTVYLPESSSNTLVINQSGTPNGYILYTHQPGKQAVIDVQHARSNAIDVQASYVIVRGLTVKGASDHAIYLSSGTDIVIEDNDVSDWGTNESGSPFGIGYQGGIRSQNSSVRRVVVQRNRIHHPATDANSWCENRDGSRNSGCGVHPLGPVAIRFSNTGGNHVIRYNTIDTDDAHYFYDNIGGQNGGSTTPNLDDSDIYGNYIERSWDNPIEAEGAGVNTRIWGNFIDRSYSPLGLNTVGVGPTYVFRNVIRAGKKGPDPADDQFCKFIKAHDSSGRIFVYHNTLLQPVLLHGMARGIDGGSNIVTRNNILHVWEGMSDYSADGSGNDYNYDLYNHSVTGGEPNGRSGTPIYASSNALYVDPFNVGTYFLASLSLGLDQGEVVPNFSDGSIGAPDMGAYEAGKPNLEFGMNAYEGGAPPGPAPSVPTNVRRSDVR